MFANASVIPKRMKTSSFLLENGNSATWLVGSTTLMTVTTSSCDLNASRNGLCDRCYLVCSKSKQQQSSDSRRGSSSLVGGGAPSEIRRRHQSEAQGPVSGLASTLESTKLQSSEPGKQSYDESKVEKVLRQTEGKKKPGPCSCWCSGWAEIHLRRPSGDVSWMCRVQNGSLFSESHGSPFIPTELTQAFFQSQLRNKEDDISSISSSNVVNVAPKEDHSLSSSPANKSQPPLRERAHTVSGMSPSKRPAAKQVESGVRGSTPVNENPSGTERVTGISPQFVFLQLYRTSQIQNGSASAQVPVEEGKPILVPNTKMMETSIRNLDRIHA